MFEVFCNYLSISRKKKEWRNINAHNFTIYRRVHGDINKIHIGNHTYGEIYVSSPNTNYDLYIGNYCSIGGDVRFLLGVDHAMDRVSTYPFKTKLLGTQVFEAISKGDIIISDDVWIGDRSIILSGVHIGQGAVVAAGAVVTKDVPPYAIAGGVPAKIIKYRFEPAMIEELLKIDYSKLDKDMIEQHIDDLYEDLIDVRQLAWLPKKK